MEKFLPAFIGTLILFAVAFGSIFLTVMVLKSFGLWGMIVPALILATLVGVMEMRDE